MGHQWRGTGRTRIAGRALAHRRAPLEVAAQVIVCSREDFRRMPAGHAVHGRAPHDLPRPSKRVLAPRRRARHLRPPRRPGPRPTSTRPNRAGSLAPPTTLRASLRHVGWVGEFARRSCGEPARPALDEFLQIIWIQSGEWPCHLILGHPVPNGLR